MGVGAVSEPTWDFTPLEYKADDLKAWADMEAYQARVIASLGVPEELMQGPTGISMAAATFALDAHIEAVRKFQDELLRHYIRPMIDARVAAMIWEELWWDRMVMRCRGWWKPEEQ
jgi:hypothetical protein